MNKVITHVSRRPRNQPTSVTESKSTPQVNPLGDRLFRIPVLVNAYKFGKLFQVRLKPGTTQADQGSDINLTSDRRALYVKCSQSSVLFPYL